MKPRKVTTIEDAQALPEVGNAIFDYSKRILERDEPGVGRRGDTINTPVARPFCPMPTDGDQILLFTDKDGRPMQVVYTPEGPAKTLWRG